MTETATPMLRMIVERKAAVVNAVSKLSIVSSLVGFWVNESSLKNAVATSSTSEPM